MDNAYITPVFLNMQSSSYPVFVITSTALCFLLIGYVVSKNTPRSAKSAWKFKNISLSLMHALTSGMWALWSLITLPEMAEDVINTFDQSSYTLVCFSVGYVIYDSMDMIMFNLKRETYELLGHHIVILICFGVTIVYRLYVGYAVVALIAELNSIFLHSRQLLQICKFEKSHHLYRLNSVATIGTFITFRLITFGWMTRWIFVNKDQISLALFSIGSVSLAILTVMNIVLLYRIMRSDFFRSLANDNKVE